MNEEEKERIKHLIERCNECKLNACITCDICWSEVQAIDKLYNLIEKQKDRILELEKALIEEDYKNRKEIETLKRDFEIVDHECSRLEQEDIKKDKIIGKLKKHNEELLRKLRNRVKEVKKLEKYSLYKKEFATLNKRIEKKDKIIDLMAKYIARIDIGEDICMNNLANTELCNEECSNCVECIKQYFERRIEQS